MKTLSFIIPVYNEEKRLEKTFRELRNLQLPAGLKLAEVIFVNDGSTDNTVSRIKYFVSSMKKTKRYHIRHFEEGSPLVGLNTKYHLLSYQPNRGKGYAVRTGMLATQADYALLFDADMSTPLSELEKFAPALLANQDVIIGNRKHTDASVIKHQPVVRELLGQGFTKLTNLMLGTECGDFTCGFKAFSRQARLLIFPYSMIDRWSYDAEIILLAHRFDLPVQEIPIMWENDTHTKVNLLRDVPHSFSDLCKIVWLHRVAPALVLAGKQFSHAPRR